MKKYTKLSKVLFGFLLSPILLATTNGPDIENGKVTKLEKYNSVIKIKKGWSSCSATLIEPYIILTAAHCVTDFNKKTKEYEEVLKEGSFIGVGSAEKVYVHPDYAVEQANGKYRRNFNYDLALIEVKKFNEYSVIPKPNFIPIINEVSSINFHPTALMVGFGAQNTNIEKDLDSHVYTHDTLKQGKKLIGQNEITNCNSCSYDQRLKVPQYHLKTNFRQIIHNYVERTDFLGSHKSGILPGDSGSPLIEFDQVTKELVLTGVASNITPLREKNKVSFTLSYAGKVLGFYALDYWPHGWELNKKSDDEFPAILKQKNLVAGELNVSPDDLVVHRQFDRESISRYVNLLYPANARFIKKSLKAIRANVKARMAKAERDFPEVPYRPNPRVQPPTKVPPRRIWPHEQKPNTPQERNKPLSLAEMINNTTCSFSEKGKKNKEVIYPHSCYCQYKSNMRDLIWKCYDVSKEKDRNGNYPRI